MLFFQRILTDVRGTVRVAVHPDDIVALEQHGFDQEAQKFRTLLLLRSGVTMPVSDYFDDVVTRVEIARTKLAKGEEK